MRKILIRFDDICPTMDFYQWGRACELLDSHHIKPLIGVIPDCKDPNLLIDEPHEEFWDYIKELQSKGYSVAMHGLIHVYDTAERGVVNHSKHSEYAGHSYEDQIEKVKKGKAILHEKGIETDVFFAPAHSYDFNTIRALAANGFNYLSDGGTLKPVMIEGVKCLPCHFSGAKLPFRFKYETIVFHTNEWAKDEGDNEYNLLKKICTTHGECIVNFNEYSNIPCGNKSVQLLFQKFFVWYDRHVWPRILKTYIKLKRK